MPSQVLDDWEADMLEPDSIFESEPDQEACWIYHDIPKDKIQELWKNARDFFRSKELYGVKGEIQRKKQLKGYYKTIFRCGPAESSNQPELELIANGLIEKLGPPRFPMRFCYRGETKLTRWENGTFTTSW